MYVLQYIHVSVFSPGGLVEGERERWGERKEGGGERKEGGGSSACTKCEVVSG